mgnify:CR=1 FL=1
MTIENQFVLEKFIEEFGFSERPDPTKMGNLDCCDECRGKCEKLAAIQMNGLAVNNYVYLEKQMGAEAYEWGLPFLVAEFLAEPTRESFA